MIQRAAFGAWLRRPGSIAALTWLAVFVAALLTGEHVATEMLATDWQVLPLSALHRTPFESIWHLHTQPPLWNVVVALAVRVGPAVSFTLLMAVAGAVLAWSLAELALVVGVGRRTAVALALLGSLAGPVLSNAFVARYELPVAALLAVLTLVAAQQRRVFVVPWVAFAVVMTRSLYHPLWFAAVLAMWWWFRRREVPWRRLLVTVALPVVVIGGWMVKNDVQVGSLSLSSWSGMNLLRSVQAAVPPDRLEQLVEQGTISPVGAVPTFSRYEAYEDVVDPCSSPSGPSAVADRTRGMAPSAFTGAMEPVTNYNYACFVPVYRQAGDDALSLMRAEPGAWFTARLWSIDNWFGVPTSTDITESPVTRSVETVSHVLLVVVPQPGIPDSWSDTNVWVHGFPVSLVLLLLTGVVGFGAIRHVRRGLRRTATFVPRSMVIALGGTIVVWTIAVGVIGELGEQERFRSMIDPLVIVIGGSMVAGWWRRRGGLQNVHLDRRTSVAGAAVVVLVLTALLVVREGPPPTLAQRPDDAVALATTSTTVVTTSTTASAVDGSEPVVAITSPSSTSTTQPPVRPTCRSVVHLGDSNLGMTKAMFEARYQELGIAATVDSANGRGATIARDGGTTALDAIARYRAQVPADGRCWIIALSSADAVFSAKNGVDPTGPIRQIHDALGGEPVLWVTPVLVSTSTEWNLAASTAYDRALAATVEGDPLATVLDWQDIALDHLDQFLDDGVHYSAPLYDLLVSTVVEAMLRAWDVQR